MNRIVLYVGLAILLGTVTMIAPLAVLEPYTPALDDRKLIVIPEDTVTAPEQTEPPNQEDFFAGDRTLEGGNFSVQATTPEPAPTEPLAPEPSPIEPEPTESCYTLEVSSGSAPDFSAIGLMTVPSFLVALGVFVYLRKRA